MNAQHTPGPWTFSRWDQFGDARFYVAQDEGAPYTPNYSDVVTLIAETVSLERVAVQEANARLIATAPELLEALQAAEKKLVELENVVGGGDDELYVEGAILMVRAAIAKATGAAA